LLARRVSITPAFRLDEDAFYLWVGLFDTASNRGDIAFNLLRTDGIVKINADVGEDKIRAHVHGQYFVNVIDVRAPAQRITNPLLHRLVGTFILANISFDFDNAISAQQVESDIAAITRSIKQAYPQIKRVFIEAESRGNRYPPG